MTLLATACVVLAIASIGHGQLFYKQNSGGYLHLIGEKSGKCAVIENNSMADEGRVVLWPCGVVAPVDGRQWRFINPDCQGSYQIQNQMSQKCMVIQGASIANGAQIVQFDCNQNLSNSRWTLQAPDASGGFQLINGLARKCLNVAGGSNNDGAVIIQWDCINVQENFWQIQYV